MRPPAENPRTQQLRLARLGVLAGLPYLCTIVVAAFSSNSDLIVADAIGTSLDVLSLIVVWVVLRARVSGVSLNLDYGYGKIESLGAFLVAVITMGRFCSSVARRSTGSCIIPKS